MGDKTPAHPRVVDAEVRKMSAETILDWLILLLKFITGQDGRTPDRVVITVWDEGEPEKGAGETDE